MNLEKICYLVGAADFGFPAKMGMAEEPRRSDTVICADAGLTAAGTQNGDWSPDHLIGDFDSLEEAIPGAGEELLRMHEGDAVRLDEDGNPIEGSPEEGTPCEKASAEGKPFGRSSAEGHLHILPPEKNLTDLQAAWRLGRSLGFRNFVMTGCFGGRRFDHSLGNLHLLLSMAREGANVCACSKDLLVFPLLSGQTFDSERGIVSDGEGGNGCDVEEGAEVPEGREQGVLFAPRLVQKNRYLSLVPAEGDVCGVTIRGLKYELTDGVIPAGSTLGISNEILEGRPFSVRIGSGSLWILISEK